MKNIIYLRGGWSTNIGNAFIGLGMQHSLKVACADSVIHFASIMPDWLFSSAGRDTKNALSIAQWIPADYLVVSGSVLCEVLIKPLTPALEKAKQNGTKFIINGGGGARYDKREVRNFRAFLKKYPPYAFVSRDRESFENYHDLAEYAHDGIDCGFFVSDCFTPTKLTLPPYVVFNFNTPPWKTLLKSLRDGTFPRGLRVKTPEIADKLIVRTHHSSWHGVSGSMGKYPHTFISDEPEGYLNLYANAQATYTDRVHAAVATLVFGKPAKLFSLTPRRFLFNKVGADSITRGLTHLDESLLQAEKQKHLDFLKKVLTA